MVIAREAARLAPPDLARQIEKHRHAFEEGVNAPFADTDSCRHMKNPDGSGQLDKVDRRRGRRRRGGDPRPQAVRGDRPPAGRGLPLRGGRQQSRSPPRGPIRRSGAISSTISAMPRRPSPASPWSSTACCPASDGSRDLSPLIDAALQPRARALSGDRRRVPADRLRLRASAASTTARRRSGWPRSPSATR